MRVLWHKERHRGTAWLYFVKWLQVLSEAVSGVRGGGVSCNGLPQHGPEWRQSPLGGGRQSPVTIPSCRAPVSWLLTPVSCLLSPVLSGQGLWLNCSCRRQRKRYQNLSNINTLFPFLTKVEKVRPTNININFLTFWLYLSEEMAWKRLVTIWPWLIHSALKIKTFYFFTFKIQIQG